MEQKHSEQVFGKNIGDKVWRAVQGDAVITLLRLSVKLAQLLGDDAEMILKLAEMLRESMPEFDLDKIYAAGSQKEDDKATLLSAMIEADSKNGVPDNSGALQKCRDEIRTKLNNDPDGYLDDFITQLYRLYPITDSAAAVFLAGKLSRDGQQK